MEDGTGGRSNGRSPANSFLNDPSAVMGLGPNGSGFVWKDPNPNTKFILFFFFKIKLIKWSLGEKLLIVKIKKKN